MPRSKKYYLTLRDYYDGGMIRIEDVAIPAKRVGYTREGDVLVAKVPFGAREFEQNVRAAYADNDMPGWPLTGRLFVAIGVTMPKSAFAVTDVDNLAKTLLDSLCGVAFQDDKQIESLFVNKTVMDKWRAWVGIHVIPSGEKATWVVEPMMLASRSSPA